MLLLKRGITVDYLKKVTVLKQIVEGYGSKGKQVSAIARLECENGVADFYLSVINIATVTQGEYYAYICDQNQTLFAFPLGKRPVSFSTHMQNIPSIEHGFCVGICFLLDHLPTLFCFSKTDGFAFDQTFFRKKIADHCLAEYKNHLLAQKQVEEKQLQKPEIEEPPCEIEHPQDPIPLPPQECDDVYDDQAVATENYFDTDDKIQLKLDEIKEFNRERHSDKNELFDSRKQTQKVKSQACDCGLQNETDISTSKNEQESPYYLTVKDELDKIFKTFDVEKSLCDLFPQSKWARINYSHNRYYVVGLIIMDGIEKYICYGVPDNYSKNPPKEFDGFCVFLPTDPKLPEGKGYWMMFQDCFTGRCALPDHNALLQ